MLLKKSGNDLRTTFDKIKPIIRSIFLHDLYFLRCKKNSKMSIGFWADFGEILNEYVSNMYRTWYGY